MGNKLITCHICGKRVVMGYIYYIKNLDKFSVQSVAELSLVYRCKMCRRSMAPIKKHRINKLPIYNKVQKLLQEEVDLFISRGLNDDMAKRNFANNLKAILDKHNIICYNFTMNDDKLTGVKIEKIPFLGEIFIPIKVK